LPQGPEETVRLKDIRYGANNSLDNGQNIYYTTTERK
jgi:hypothetical protein